ncbi:MAG: bacterioferritin [Myxococcales bacterium]|nr:bacterioferritin [Myxococcales bacterium]
MPSKGKRSTDQAIINALNEILTAELTAINQYFLHAKMCQDWGYQKLYEYIRHESIDEMKHADALIERILYLGGLPNVQRLFKVNIGETVQEQFEADLELEYLAVPRLQKAIDLCLEKSDEGTRVLLSQILTSEEEHIDWLEAQLELIGQVGLQNYLAQQIHG